MLNNNSDISQKLIKEYNMSRSQASSLAEQLSRLHTMLIKGKREDVAELLTHLIELSRLPVETVIDRRILYKLRKVPGYRTEKMRLIRAGLIMKLDLEDIEDLLSVSGYAFSDSLEEDIVCRFLFQEKLFAPYEIGTVFKLSGVNIPVQIKEMLEGKSSKEE